MKWLKLLKLKYRLRGKPVRLNLGAGQTRVSGWESTDIDTLNLLKRKDWLAIAAPNSVHAMLSEHVWEHLTETQGREAATLCFEFLRPGGHLRIAVPDGLNPDTAYQEYVRPGGTGSGADDHKMLYTHVTFASLFASVGFKVDLLEYWNEEGTFFASEWEPKDGLISRSKRFDPRNQNGTIGYTSLILDATKPV